MDLEKLNLMLQISELRLQNLQMQAQLIPTLGEQEMERNKQLRAEIERVQKEAADADRAGA